jgi:hypothetical protein
MWVDRRQKKYATAGSAMVAMSIVISSTQPLKIGIEAFSFTGRKWNKIEM